MEPEKTFENYPKKIVAASNLLSLAMYAIGAYLMLGFGILAVALYLLLCLYLELRVLSHCRDCYYYGKACFSGKGKLCSKLLKRGDPKRFSAMKLTMRDLIPDFSVVIIPAVCGALLLIRSFDWLILGLVILIVLLGTAGTGMVRGSLACKHCRQRELGCPACELFGKKAKT